MIKKILIGFFLLVTGILSYAAIRPAQMFVSREIIVAATPEALFPYINNAKKCDDWMPWKESDPGVVMSYSGPEEGVGSKSSWNSEGQMGSGEALVVESVQNQRVKTELTYTKPFQMRQLAEISLTPVDGGTRVVWSVSGQKNYFFRLMGIFVDCDEMIGQEFEKGLSTLKSRVET